MILIRCFADNTPIPSIPKTDTIVYRHDTEMKDSHKELKEKKDTIKTIPNRNPQENTSSTNTYNNESTVHSNKQNLILILNFDEIQENTNLTFTGMAKLSLNERNKSLNGTIDYKLKYVPSKYKNERALQGNPTGTELVKGNYDGNNYKFKGYDVLNNQNNLYTTDIYNITLSSLDNSFFGTTAGNVDGSTKINGTYILSSE